MQNVLYKNAVCLSGLMLLTACASTAVVRPPEYQAPKIQADEQYKYAGLNWTATGALQPAGADWWQIYQDPMLSRLMQQLNQENLSLQQAEARFRYANALLQQQQAARQPSLALNASANRSGGKNTASSSQFGSEIQASWIPDLWGRVAKAIEGQQANLEAIGAELQAVKLSQQLLAAEAYWNIRVLDAQISILQQTQQSYARSVQILKNQYVAGMIARADVIQAETQLKQVQIQQLEQQRERHLQEHILAALQGKTAAQFQLAKQQSALQAPAVPVQLPSRLLLQRPDVLRAERELAATHAQLGLAQTAWLPDVSIGLNSAVNSQIFSQLFQAPQYLWSAGLKAAAVLWDGGQRKAGIAAAQANYDEKTAAYKQAVLTGWKEVEDALMQSASFRQQQAEQVKLSALAAENERAVTRRYNAGLVSYLEVVSAQNLRLQAEQAALELKQLQLKNTAQLIAALGGNYS
ncbi:efflux transporter outer membrane subunit [Acinetobacter sp. WCHAc010034]|uniref:efflux transporter outer membrane subunit n=1 Tax=Acinetobacter sp. WCHAc010034 TaxID=1879049 RepID=UPI00083AEC0C|nr:efflux transporter outer membrane subunit [Acinetobacter sp. WCHAc010034]AYA02519.1 efflux transporter outer membrane subunit [Acinetobacter sp. WCHAc010034]